MNWIFKLKSGIRRLSDSTDIVMFFDVSQVYAPHALNQWSPAEGKGKGQKLLELLGLQLVLEPHAKVQQFIFGGFAGNSLITCRFVAIFLVVSKKKCIFAADYNQRILKENWYGYIG